MKDSIWAYLTIVFGFLVITLIFFMQRITTYDQHDYVLLREATETAMYAAVDTATLNSTGEVKIDAEKFRLNFVKAFADNADLSKKYKIYIYDISTEPPKVSLKVVSTVNENSFNMAEFTITNKLDAILETKK